MVGGERAHYLITGSTYADCRILLHWYANTFDGGSAGCSIHQPVESFSHLDAGSLLIPPGSVCFRSVFWWTINLLFRILNHLKWLHQLQFMFSQFRFSRTGGQNEAATLPWFMVGMMLLCSRSVFRGHRGIKQRQAESFLKWTQWMNIQPDFF